GNAEGGETVGDARQGHQFAVTEGEAFFAQGGEAIPASVLLGCLHPHRRPPLTTPANPILRYFQPFPAGAAPAEAPRHLKAPPGCPTLQVAVAGLPARARGMLDAGRGPSDPYCCTCPMPIPPPALLAVGSTSRVGSHRTKQRRSSVEGFAT